MISGECHVTTIAEHFIGPYEGRWFKQVDQNHQGHVGNRTFAMAPQRYYPAGTAVLLAPPSPCTRLCS